VNEVTNIKEAIIRLLRTSHPDYHIILGKFLSIESFIYFLFKTEIEEFVDHNLFLRFIGIFLFLAYNDNLSTSMLKDLALDKTFSDLIKTSALLCIQYNVLWRKIAISGLNKII